MRTLTALVLVVLGACAKSPSSASPPADCTPVAETFVSFRMGNYAPRDQREAASSELLEACKTAHVSAGEAKCVFAMKTEWEAKQCVPGMFPELSAGDDDLTADCAKIADKVASSIPKGKSKGEDWVGKTIAAVKVSCVEDKWPTPVRQCMLATPIDKMKGDDACGLSRELQRKVKDRMSGKGTDASDPPPPPPPAKG